ncbi:MAG: hypothetical protein Q7T97_18020 [Burkholderiaceae bacterium]|nr:hypothetical protein [Burkholderiaceae bacterium]
MSNYTSRTGSPYLERPAPPPIENDGWESTRALTALATQIMDREGEERTAHRQEIGRPVGNGVRELFVACAPGEALQQQFEHLHPEFIAVHDLATRSSRQLLRGIAAASNRAVQKLVLRRQGGGAPVATIEFIEVPVSPQEVLRIYSTDIDDTTDAVARHAVARTLMAYSQLGVMMVGSVPAENIHATLRPWHEEVIRSPWLNRNLLLLPLTNSTTLMTNGQNMVRGTSITLRTTPVVTRPADAWNFINGTWSRLRGSVAPMAAPSAPARSQAPTAGTNSASTPNHAAARVGAQIDAGYRPPATPVDPSGFAPTNMLPLRPMPDVMTRPVPMQDEVLEVYVHQVCELNGVVGCCVFDIGSGLPVAHGGAGAPPEELARHGRALLSAMGTASRSLGLGHTMPDAAITLGSHHLLLRSVAKHSGMALLTVLDRTNANLTLARLQIERLDPLLDR